MDRCGAEDGFAAVPFLKFMSITSGLGGRSCSASGCGIGPFAGATNASMLLLP